jgi:carbonic anhydrase
MQRKYTDIQELLSAYKKNKTNILNSKKYIAAVNNGQQPNIMFIACCDSRLDPALIFNLELGDIFTLRSIANIVPAYDHTKDLCSTSAAIEFVATNTTITDIIILGHSKCAGITAMCNNEHNTQSHLSNWIHANKITKQLASYPEDITNSIDKHALESLVHSYQNLRLYPQIRTNKIGLHAWFYQLESATLKSYIAQTNEFINL